MPIITRTILTLSSIFLVFWFRIYFTSTALPSVDLPSFTTITEQFRQHLLTGRFTFYDHTAFTGWVPLHFYGWLPSFLACVLSLPLELITNESVRLSLHIIMVFGFALLPWTVWYASKPCVEEFICVESLERPYAELLHSISVATFAFWFLNHDQQWYGIGAAAVAYIGLFSQLFAWHFLLLYFGLLLRSIKTNSQQNIPLLCVIFAALLVSHTLTSVFLLLILSIFFLRLRSSRKIIIASVFFGSGLVAFWLVPQITYLSTYTTFDIYRPKGDLLAMFFRYPLHELIRSIPNALAGHGYLLQPMYFFLPILTLVFLSRARSDSLIFLTFLAIILSTVIFSSGFVASSIKIGLHYYRFLGYAFLMLTVVYTALPVLALEVGNHSKLVMAILVGALIACFAVDTQLPHIERKLVADHADQNYLKDEQAVIDYFKSQSSKGRVFTEYLTDYKTFTPLSAHYISSRLFKESGFEAITNSHHQESLAYRMISASAKSLGAKVYGAQHIFLQNAHIEPDAAIQGMRSFGITHVVAGRKQFLDTLTPYATGPITKYGPYSIIPIKESNFKAASIASKLTVGYLDVVGNAPFAFMEYYLFAHSNIYSKIDLIELNSDTIDSANINYLLINTRRNSRPSELTAKVLQRYSSKNVIELNFQDPYKLNHYHVNYPHNMELDAYRALEQRLGEINFTERLLEMTANTQNQVANNSDSVTFEWNDYGQSMILSGLIPKQLYRINYSYFPYWQSNDGQVFRGSDERIFFLPDGDKARLGFSRWSKTPAWYGLAISIVFCAALLLGIFRKKLT